MDPRPNRCRHRIMAGTLLALSFLAATLVVQPAASAKTRTFAATPTQVLTFLDENERPHLIDNPPRATGPLTPETISVGDMDAFTSELWTARKPSRRVGTFHQLCIVTLAGKHAAATCTGTLVLPSGTLSFSNFFRFADDIHHVAITGGTGAYEGLRGSLSGRSSPGNDAINIITIRLFR
jgi:hypothetical protein